MEEKMNNLNLNIGCGTKNFGEDWIHIDGNKQYFHVKEDDVYLKKYDNYSVNKIYSSHFLEYFDYQEAEVLLKGWYNKLKDGGEIYLSVPDFRKISDLYKEGVPLSNLIGPLYGKINLLEKSVYHKTAWDFNNLSFMLKLIGFKRIEEYNPVEVIGSLDDCSKAEINGKLISLNVRAIR
jgi:predicted SAM-dependent methyltransferase